MANYDGAFVVMSNLFNSNSFRHLKISRSVDQGVYFEHGQVTRIFFFLTTKLQKKIDLKSPMILGDYYLVILVLLMCIKLMV